MEKDQERNPRLVDEEQKLSMGFVNLFNKYYQFPECYENELARLVAEEEDAQEEDPKRRLGGSSTSSRRRRRRSRRSWMSPQWSTS